MIVAGLVVLLLLAIPIIVISSRPTAIADLQAFVAPLKASHTAPAGVGGDDSRRHTPALAGGTEPRLDLEEAHEAGRRLRVGHVVKMLGLLATIACITAIVSAIQMLQYRHVELGVLVLNGMAFFDDASWQPEALPHRQRFVAAVVSFFVTCVPCVLLGVALSATSAKKDLKKGTNARRARGALDWRWALRKLPRKRNAGASMH